MKESRTRSFFKGITFRLLATVLTVVILYAVTGSMQLAASIGAIDLVVKFFAYYLHERAWGRVNWGLMGAEAPLTNK